MADDKYTPPSADEAPWLITMHDNNERKLLQKQTICTMSPMLPKNNIYFKRITELHGKYILGSSLGWLILQERKDHTMFSLWNPVTSKSVHLPALVDAPHDEVRPKAVFTSAPYQGNDDDDANQACVLLVFFESLVCFCRPTANEGCKWNKQSIEHEGASVTIKNVVTVNGDVYAYAQQNVEDESLYRAMIVRMKVADIETKSIVFEPSVVELPDSHPLNFTPYGAYATYLVEVSGVLHIVHAVCRLQDNIENFDLCKAFIWKLDLTHMKWILVESLGNRALLLGDYGSTWCWAPSRSKNALKDRIEADCVYLTTTFYTVLSYSLRDDHYTCLLPHRNFIWHAVAPSWFMPHPIGSRFLPSEDEETKEDIDSYLPSEDEETKENNLLSQLPSHILLSITDRMHLFHRLNLRLTCNSIRSVIPSTKWRQEGRLYPSLISFKSYQGICELWDPFETTPYNKYTITTPYSPNDNIIIESCKGNWLLLRIGEDTLEYFNPFTYETIKCPSCRVKYFTTSHAFSTLPKNSDCISLRIEGLDTVVYIASFQAASSSSEEWEYDLFDDADFRSSSNSNPIWFNGAFYLTGVKGKLGGLESLDQKWSWKLYDSPLSEAEQEYLNSCYLLEFDGQLTSVCFLEDGATVLVFKFELSEKKWTELDDLGDNVLFLSHLSSFSIVEKDKMKRNRIYLPMCAGNEIVYYSLDTCQYHTLSNEDSRDDLYGVTTQPFWCWI